MRLSLDLFRLHWTAAAQDPYDAVLQFGRVNAALGAIRPAAHKSLRIRSEDLETRLDLNETHPVIETRIVLSIQIWEIILLAVCAGAAGLRWILRKKRSERAGTHGKLREEQKSWRIPASET